MVLKLGVATLFGSQTFEKGSPSRILYQPKWPTTQKVTTWGLQCKTKWAFWRKKFENTLSGKKLSRINWLAPKKGGVHGQVKTLEHGLGKVKFVISSVCDEFSTCDMQYRIKIETNFFKQNLTVRTVFSPKS